MFRLAFALSLAIALLPAANISGQSQSLNAQSIQVSTLDTLSAAKSVYDDMRGFCQRNQEACLTADALIGQFKARAHSGLQWVSAYLQNDPRVKPDQVVTGSLR